MRNIPKGIKIAVFVLVVLLFLAQAIRIDRSNPGVRSDLAAEPAVKAVLRRACYDCHSSETVWPWYSGIAPASWLVSRDVQGGRRHLNFSEWGIYDGGTRSNKLREIAEEVREGGMPLWYYTLIHRDSRLTEAERNQILAWTAEATRAESR